MIAIKAARAHTGRPAIAKCEGAYHGTYDFAEVSEGTSPSNWGEIDSPESVPTSRGTPKGVLEDVVVVPFNDPDRAEPILRRNADRLAGILVDPMPNRAGLMPASTAFLQMLRRVADDIGALLIFDEVITFRLGYHGAQGHFGIRPDLTCLGKIIGGGFPVGAIGGRADVMAVFDPRRGKPAVPHGGTFSANPITMVAGHASMSELTEEAFTHLEALGNQLQRGLEQVMEARQIAGQVMGLGSLRRVHFTREPIKDYRSTVVGDMQVRLLKAVHRGMLDAGVIIASTGLMALSTVMTSSDVEKIIDAFDSGLEGAARQESQL